MSQGIGGLSGEIGGHQGVSGVHCRAGRECRYSGQQGCRWHQGEHRGVGCQGDIGPLGVGGALEVAGGLGA